MTSSGSILGNAVLRLEDPTLLTGTGKYLDDLVEPGMLHLAFVRSMDAHGELKGVDVAVAEAMPGVRAVFHAGNDLGLPPMQMFAMMPPALNRPMFCTDRVRFVGDVCAAVVAESKAQAVDAADTVILDIEPLPAMMTPAASLDPDAPLLFPEHGSNVCFTTSHGDDARPLDGADLVAQVTMVSQRLAGVPMETNGIVAVPDGNGSLTCWISHQAPHAAHGALAAILGLDPESLRVVCPWVGGGFGPKAAVYAEYAIAAKAAMDLAAPVKWSETRAEDMISLVHGRDYVMDAKLGVTSNGRIVGFEANVTASAGAYPAIGAILPMLTQMMSVGVYDIPAVKFSATSALTNNTTVGAYRGAGRPEATQLIERVLDVAADLTGVDPAEIRRMNFIQEFHEPITTPTGGNYDSGRYAEPLDAALAAAGYDELRSDQERRRAAGEVKQLGIGVSTYVEVTAPVGLHLEYGVCEVHDDGTATVYAGTSAHGQGHHTAFAMLASDVLGIAMDKISLVNSDTKTVRSGNGTWDRDRSRQQARRSTLHRPRSSTGPGASLAISSRHPPTTSSRVTVGCRLRAFRPRRSRGTRWRPRPTTRRDCPRAWSQVRSVTTSTSTVAARPFPSAPTCPWWRSTWRQATSGCSATSRSTTADGSSTPCWSEANNTAASLKAPLRRCTNGCSTTMKAIHRRQPWWIT